MGAIISKLYNAIAGAYPWNAESPAAVFKLDEDCWDEVFDWLSVRDVQAFGRTCKSFQKVAGTYFQWKYRAYEIWYGSYFGADEIPDFIQFIQDFCFEGSLGVNFVSKCKGIKHVRLNAFLLSKPLIKSLIPVLPALETFDTKQTFDVDNYVDNDVDIYEEVLKHCVKLKCLRIYSNFHDECLCQKYPSLEHLHITAEEPFENDNLKTFFKLNPSVRRLTTNCRTIYENLRFFVESKIQLDDLIISDREMYIGFDDKIESALNDLYQCQFYKKLHILGESIMPSIGQLAAPLVTLHFQDEVKLISLSSLMELGFYSTLRQNRGDAANITEIPHLCVNLERLLCGVATVAAILPFICFSRKLKEIIVLHLHEEILDISKLNNERKQFEGAKKVIIYVSEDVYLATKWAKKATSLDLVEMQRYLSREDKREYGLRFQPPYYL